MGSTKLSEAASLMGRLGGTVVTPKKLEALRKNVQKAWGKKKGKTYPMKKKAASRKPPPQDPELMTRMASLLGRAGGMVKSERKAAASRLNARGGPDGKGKKAGRRPVYHYTLKTNAVLGPRARHRCIIPDEVVADFRAFEDKTFPARYKGSDGKVKRAKVKIFSRDRKEIVVIQTFTKPEQFKKSTKPGSTRRKRQGPAVSGKTSK